MNEDLTGKKFERLTVIKKNKDRKNHWICKCDCGNIVSVLDFYLIHGKTKSCGCYRADRARKHLENIRKNTQKANNELRFEGTKINALTKSVCSNSKSGVKGVVQVDGGKYTAAIKLRGKTKHLGTYENIEEAKKARKMAEKLYYQPIIEKYEKMKKKK